MLQAKTEEQKDKVEEILSSVELWELDGDDGIFINDSVSFDKLAELTDYLRSVQPKKTERFIKPTIDEIKAHILEKGYTFDAEAFYAFYESNGWKVGKNPMKNWKMACTTWAKNRKNNNNNNVNYGRETITEKIRRTVAEANAFSQQLTDRINNNQQADVCDGDNDDVW